MGKYAFHVPDNKRVRVMVLTDCKNEADDQYALAHHLMTPRFEVEGIVACHFAGKPREYGPLGSAKASMDEILKVMDLMGLTGTVPVALGAPSGMKDEETPVVSDGAKLIVERAKSTDPRPLYLACQGNLTDVAAALLLDPSIASKIVVIWVGGAPYPKGGFEFNLKQDIHAVNVVFASKAEVWQLPMNIYKQFAVSLAELQWKVAPCGAIGKYLFEELVAFNDFAAGYNTLWPQGEIWGLGDQATVAVLMEELEKKSYDLVPAPRIAADMTYLPAPDPERKIRVYHTVDARLTLEDFFAKLAINYR